MTMKVEWLRSVGERKREVVSPWRIAVIDLPSVRARHRPFKEATNSVAGKGHNTNHAEHID